MNHLYDEAQLLDIRSREQAITFTLAPRPPHMGLLDFSINLIEISIAKGYREANGDLGLGTNNSPSYRKELSEPVFWTAPMEKAGSESCKELSL